MVKSDRKIIRQCKAVFFNLFGSRHSVRLKKNWRHPQLAKMTIWATLSCKKNLNGSKFNIWRHPRHLFTAPLCAAAPRLGTTDVRAKLNAFTRFLFPTNNLNIQNHIERFTDLLDKLNLVMGVWGCSFFSLKISVKIRML